MNFAFSLTAQQSLDNPWLPNERGVYRRNGLIGALRKDRYMRLVGLGGYPNHLGFTYADREMAALFQKEPWLTLDRLVLISGDSNRTSEDIYNACKVLTDIEPHDPAGSAIHVCTHEYHFLRIRNPIVALGYDAVWIDSGEETLPLFSEDGSEEKAIAQSQIDDLSTLFGRGKASEGWKKVAQAQAEKDADYCRQWAETHPELEKEMHERTVQILRKLRDADVTIHTFAQF